MQQWIGTIQDTPLKEGKLIDTTFRDRIEENPKGTSQIGVDRYFLTDTNTDLFSITDTDI